MECKTESGHYILGATQYGDSRCTTCEHNRACFSHGGLCQKDVEVEEQLFKNVDFLLKEVQRLSGEVEVLKSIKGAGETYTYGIR